MQNRLARKLNTFDAVIIGMGAMIGAGTCCHRPSPQVAGSGVLPALVIAAAVAYCNAASSAELAALSW